ncbi:MAG: 23S rRNA (adenine2503-C2)-methyltransferase [Halobacteriales archaeon]|jgi:23S rRNA (adenine2503-C2)-methyltransferase
MEIIHQQGNSAVASAYLARFEDGEGMVEFVDSLGGAHSRREKWVLIVSSLYGCPVECKFCDAGVFYDGPISTENLMAQVNYLIDNQPQVSPADSDKFKVQFARIGEPAFNDAVLDAILAIRDEYEAPNYMPCISTVAPTGRDDWFERLKRINHNVFQGNFQLQFSVHSTDEDYREFLIPADVWELEEIAEYANRFYDGGRKVTLNFALSEDTPFDPDKLASIFDPDTSAIKITPLNPTAQAENHDIVNVFDQSEGEQLPVIDDMEDHGFDVYLSIGDLRENEILSNCGQVLLAQTEVGDSLSVSEPEEPSI